MDRSPSAWRRVPSVSSFILSATLTEAILAAEYSRRVKWLSASWRTKYGACLMRRPPVLNKRCWRLVSDQLWKASDYGLIRSPLKTKMWDDTFYG
jgi:hypothetical protein